MGGGWQTVGGGTRGERGGGMMSSSGYVLFVIPFRPHPPTHLPTHHCAPIHPTTHILLFTHRGAHEEVLFITDILLLIAQMRDSLHHSLYYILYTEAYYVPTGTLHMG